MNFTDMRASFNDTVILSLLLRWHKGLNPTCLGTHLVWIKLNPSSINPSRAIRCYVRNMGARYVSICSLYAVHFMTCAYACSRPLGQGLYSLPNIYSHYGLLITCCIRYLCFANFYQTDKSSLKKNFKAMTRDWASVMDQVSSVAF